jgi:NAD(P)-dependent dehydrogenase (short-subunit alcohol dehydrogenase family)
VALARAGHDVAVTARDASRLTETTAAVEAEGARAAAVVLDVTDPASVPQAVDAVRSELGALRVLVNNAGVASSAPFADITLEDWLHAFAVNATGAFLVAQAVLPDLLAAGSGRIVNVASTAAVRGFKYTAHYAASKHALLGMSRALALEVAASGVTVNCVCPGFVDTEMTQRSVANLVAAAGMTEAQAREALARQNPQGRLIAPDEVAAAVVYLAGDAARGVNGQTLVI